MESPVLKCNIKNSISEMCTKDCISNLYFDTTKESKFLSLPAKKIHTRIKAFREKSGGVKYIM